MILTQRQRWAIVAAGAAALAAPLAERVVAGTWRLATAEDPPSDPIGQDVSWGRALAWTATSAVVIALAQVAARRAAAVAWERRTGRRPPSPKKRRGPRARRRARGLG